jgi:putative ABC transport system permease protein
MHRLDPGLPIYAVKTVESVISEQAWPFRFFMYLLVTFAVIALLLAAVGLSGIMARMVIERRHEIGIRMALGATAPDVVAMIVNRGIALVTVGAFAGLGASLQSSLA